MCSVPGEGVRTGESDADSDASSCIANRSRSDDGAEALGRLRTLVIDTATADAADHS